jgi:hypothetical protein
VRGHTASDHCPKPKCQDLACVKFHLCKCTVPFIHKSKKGGVWIHNRHFPNNKKKTKRLLNCRAKWDYDAIKNPIKNPINNLKRNPINNLKRSAELAAAADAAAAANPKVLDRQRPVSERLVIVRNILEVLRAMYLSASASVLVFATRRCRIGAPWAEVEEALWDEGPMTFSRRGYQDPVLLDRDDNVISVGALVAAGVTVEPVYVTDRMNDGTGSVNKNAVEGLVIRALEESHDLTDAKRNAKDYLAATASYASILNKSASAKGCEHKDGFWAMVALLIIPGGWKAMSWKLMNGVNEHIPTAAAAAAAAAAATATAAATTTGTAAGATPGGSASTSSRQCVFRSLRWAPLCRLLRRLLGSLIGDDTRHSGADAGRPDGHCFDSSGSSRDVKVDEGLTKQPSGSTLLLDPPGWLIELCGSAGRLIELCGCLLELGVCAGGSS